MKSNKITVILIFHSLFLFCFVSKTYSQCNCERIIKENIISVGCPPMPVSSENQSQVGLSILKINNDYLLAATVRFKYNAIEILGNFSLWLEDGNSIELEYTNGGLAYIGNNQVAQATFNISQSDLLKIKKSKLKTISFKLDDNIKRVYKVTSYSDILIKHIRCIE